MPIYEFRCQKCNDQIEVYQKLSDKPPTRCRKCGGRMEKQFSRTSVQFKGEVAEKVEKELSTPEPASGEKAKPKKTPAKKTGGDKS